MKTWHVYAHDTKKAELVKQGWNWKYIVLGVLTLVFPPITFALPLLLWLDNCNKQALVAFALQCFILFAGIKLILSDPEGEMWFFTSMLGFGFLALPVVAAKFSAKWREVALLANGYIPLGYTIEANTRKEVFAQIAENTKKLEAAKSELDQGLAEAFAVMDDPDVQSALKDIPPETQKAWAELQKERAQYLKEWGNT
jgi:hypothetical protein